MSCCAAAWICSVSSIRLRSTWARNRSISSGGGSWIWLATISRPRRWSTSLPVMTSPLTIAVALRTPGSCLADELDVARECRAGLAGASPPCAAAITDSTGAINTIAALA